MIVLEAKLKGTDDQYGRLDEAIRTAQFVRNSCIRYWMDNRGVGKADLSKLCARLAKEFEWADKLNSMARPAHQLKEHGSLSLGSTKTVGKRNQEKKDIPSSERMFGQLSTKHLVGSCQIIVTKSRSLMDLRQAPSKCVEVATSTSTK